MPARKASVRIDGELVQVAEGRTILDAARQSGRAIPTLCHFDGLQDVGACRLCVVEVAGIGRLLPSCTTPVQDGMSVITTSPRLTSYRRMIVELLLAERNHVCSVCVSNCHCELQSAAAALGVQSVRFPYRYPRLGVDLSHERYVLDHNRCILCTRCVRVCGDTEGAHVWNIGFRGVQSRLVSDLDQPWGQSATCTACGKCVEACPTGAMAEKGKAGGEMVKRSGRISAVAARKGVQTWTS